jgi:hypothetical protein
MSPSPRRSIEKQLKRKATLKMVLELSIQEDGELLKKKEGKDVSEASMEMVEGQQLLDDSLVAVVHELHPLMVLSDGTHQKP